MRNNRFRDVLQAIVFFNDLTLTRLLIEGNTIELPVSDKTQNADAVPSGIVLYRATAVAARASDLIIRGNYLRWTDKYESDPSFWWGVFLEGIDHAHVESNYIDLVPSGTASKQEFAVKNIGKLRAYENYRPDATQVIPTSAP